MSTNPAGNLNIMKDDCINVKIRGAPEMEYRQQQQNNTSLTRINVKLN